MNMEEDTIVEIGIDEQERLYIVPKSQTFPFIYREAMEVHWDAQGGFLYSPKPGEWNYFEWFMQIVSAAKEQACTLHITNKTKWINVPNNLKTEIEKQAAAMGNSGDIILIY